MNAPAKLEDRHIERLWRQICAKLVPQTVVRENSHHRFFLIDSTGPRVEALLASPAWAKRIVGTFSPDVGYEVLCEEVG
ncbi:hypothetical protein [Propionivibrio sp.]|uniref:hypothetical protein n=1 Tax=Propionivibrio sp. TaxID=2212460 RepID=UPI0025F33F4B|nr:hypothetical protein [Propionivibrio sp.]MBK8746101.1 hypothetical protein [Propionivibrio sp.]